MKVRWMSIVSLLVTACSAKFPTWLNAQESHTTHTTKYHATINDVKYVYGVAEPVARLGSADVLETNTLDAFGNAIQKVGDGLSMVKGDNPLTGPFFAEGAEPGDTLAVKILDLQVDGDQGVGALGPGFGALNATNYTPMLGSSVPRVGNGAERFDQKPGLAQISSRCTGQRAPKRAPSVESNCGPKSPCSRESRLSNADGRSA